MAPADVDMAPTLTLHKAMKRLIPYSPVRRAGAAHRTLTLVGAAGLVAAPALAQISDPAPVAEPDEAAPLEPALPPLPPLPPSNTDFKKDQKLFEEVDTAPESLAGEPSAAVQGEPLLYEELPALAFTTQAVAGVMAAGLVGLAGANLGELIDEPDELQPLGGFHGPVFGGFAGTAIGSALGVWAGGQLFDKQTHPGWIALGSAAGTLVGSGAALGVAAIGGNDETTATLAVGTALIFQVGGAILFGELFLPPPETVRRESDRGLIRPPDEDL